MKTLLRLLAVSVMLSLSGCYTRYILTDEEPVKAPAYYPGYYWYNDGPYSGWYPPYYVPRHYVRVPIVVHREHRRPESRPSEQHKPGSTGGQRYQNPTPPRQQAPPPATSRNSGTTRSK